MVYLVDVKLEKWIHRTKEKDNCVIVSDVVD